MRPSISIVTPSFNQGGFIAAAVESVLRQGYPDFEHLVLDNCSKDGTADILKKYGHLKWVCEPDRGQSDALNKGFKKAQGDIIGWLNADDFYLDGCFSKIAEAFARNKDADIIYGDYRLVNGQGKTIQNRRELDFDLFSLKYLHVLCIPSTALFFKRKIFDEGNFLDASYHYAMDYEFFLRLASKGYKFSHITGFLAGFRRHEDSKSSVFALKQKNEKIAALLAHDRFLCSLPGFLRGPVRVVLMLAAKAKRYYFKMIRGYYFDQWVKATR